jgi:hypothetical protein
MKPEKKPENMILFFVMIWLGGFMNGILASKLYLNSEVKSQIETERMLCQKEFNEDLATVSIEHKSPVLHKGTKPNRILIICQ